MTLSSTSPLMLMLQPFLPHICCPPVTCCPFPSAFPEAGPREMGSPGLGLVWPPDQHPWHWPQPDSSSPCVVMLLRTECLCHVEILGGILTPNVMVLGGGAFER